MPVLNSGLIKKQVERTLDRVWLIAKRDGRIHVAQTIYQNRDFLDVLTRYFSFLSACNTEITESNVSELKQAVRTYLVTVDSMFDYAKPQFLTTMRSVGGRTFVNAYKRSVELRKMLELESSDDLNLEPIDVPNQQPSPIYAKIEENKIVLDLGHSLRPLLDRGALENSRKYLKGELAALSDTLTNSNIDRRFVGVFLNLNRLIDFKDDAGAIALGLHVRAVGHLMRAIEHEVSDVIALQISSILTHIGYFAAQYKDWIEFLTNAQHYPARETIEEGIDQALESLCDTLIAHAASVDQRIPDSIRLISQLLKGTREDRANAIYAGVRGFENICIVAVRYAYDQAVAFVRDAGSTARPTLVKIAAGTIILVALSMIADFLPVIRSAPELNWILENLPRFEKIQRILNRGT
jgi:hypothetical protein